MRNVHSLNFLFLILLLVSSPVYAKRWVILPGSVTLKSAILKASAHDTLIVQGGNYNEFDLEITKPLVLIGKSRPSIDAQNKSGIFIVTASGTVIKGFRLLHIAIGSMEDYAAIRVLNADHVILEDNEVVKSFFGFHFSQSNNGLIRNNKLIGNPSTEHQTGNGIHLWKCDSFQITKNRISGHRDGIYFEFVTNSSISENESRGNMRYGLHFMFSHNDVYSGNVFSNNGAGVAVMYSRQVNMRNNQFSRNQGPSSYGLLLKDISDSEVIQNNFENNTVGIYMEGSSRNNFFFNVFFGNGWAVKLQASCDGNLFKKSNFICNTFDIATNGTLVLNTFQENYWDKYQGYDLNHDLIGDVPFRPVSLFSMLVERVPFAVLSWRSFFVMLLDQAERVFPAFIPENLKDSQPLIRPNDLG